MSTIPRRIGAAFAALGATSLVLAGCASANPLAAPSKSASSNTGGEALVVGSQDYYSSEIIAELYALALEERGYSIKRDFRIGQREVYLPEIESGAIDLFPEYSGPLLQVWADNPPQRESEQVYTALTAAAPEGLTVLEQSPATDQDAFVVTREFAEANDLTTIADLANVEGKVTLGANSEAETRPNGPKGLAAVYGLDVGFTPIEDGGGPLTIRALEDGDVQLAIMYTGDPTITKNELVVLEDPEGLLLASNIVPVASDNVDEEARAIVNKVSAALTSDELLALNGRSQDEQSPAATIAGDWLQEQGLIE